MGYKAALEEVVDYLNGKYDLYDGKHSRAIEVWNEAWDEMRFLGHDPESATGIRNYISKEL